METLVLLGAGASCEAGIPTATEMTRVLIDEIAASGQYTLLQAVRYVEAGLRFAAVRRSYWPAPTGDVEELLNAIELLEQRRDLELSSFVGSWDSFIDTLEHDQERGHISDVGRELQELLREAAVKGALLARSKRANEYFSTSDFERALEASLASPEPRPVFHSLKRALLRALVKTAWVDNSRMCDYLAPLLRSQRVRTIASLNYDNSIELTAADTGVLLTTGIDDWIAERRDFARPPDGKLLLNLHGSVDWGWTSREPMKPSQFAVAQREKLLHPGSSGQPAILFGGRVKLTARPFLEMLTAFRRDLQLAKSVVAIGYSFRDDHVKEYIVSWLHGGADRNLIIVDPHPPDRLVSPQYAYYGQRDLMGINWPTTEQQIVSSSCKSLPAGRYRRSLPDRGVSENM